MLLICSNYLLLPSKPSEEDEVGSHIWSFEKFLPIANLLNLLQKIWSQNFPHRADTWYSIEYKLANVDQRNVFDIIIMQL